MRRALAEVVGFVHRFAYAVLFGFLGFVPCVIPLPDDAVISLPRRLLEGICYTFNWPVSLVTRLQIPYFVGLDVFGYRGVGEFMSIGEMLIWHMRVAVPTFLAIFYLLRLLALAVQRLRRSKPPVAVA